MKLTFQQQLDEELLRSERRRTIIVISIFLFAMAYRLVDLYFFKQDGDAIVIQSSMVIWVFPLLIILFELASLLYIVKRVKSKKGKIPMPVQFLNTAFEIALPSLIILTISRQYPSYDILRSPALYIYFIFIILSTLRLNFALSFFCGLLAAISYITFRISIDGHFGSSDTGRAMVIFLSGIAAGLVARQIRAGIDHSIREAEKRQMVENLFGQQVSLEVAEKMLANDGRIETRRMKVAIMFIDIRNFTRFAVGRNPEEIVQYQNAFFSIVINVVSRYHGIVHQFLGDGCMVTFGAPLDLPNPSQNAVDAAIHLLSAVDEAVKGRELPGTRIGLGIHTGEVVTGNIGTRERQQYSITGHVVILASRIEQLNKQFDSQLLVSEDVIQSVNAALPAVKMDPVELKGWHEPVPIYKLA
jgi:adenylate cyclase